MRERYQVLSPDAQVFRTAKVGGGFLPAGHVLPKPEWLEPNKGDQEEARESGRLAGISVWDSSVSVHGAACWIRNVEPNQHISFVVTIADAHAVAAEHKRAIAVVVDPLAPPPNDARWASLEQPQMKFVLSTSDGHSLIEGIKRPSEVQEKLHRSFRESLARRFEPLPESALKF